MQVAIPVVDEIVDAAHPVISVPSFVNSTVPLNVVLPAGAVTSAVNVTDWLMVDVTEEELSASVVVAALTICVTVALLVP